MIKPPNFETLLNHVLLLEILIEKQTTQLMWSCVLNKAYE